MWLLIIAALLQQAIPGVLSAPDPAQMEKAPDLGYKPVPHGLQMPSTITMGAPVSLPSSAASDAMASARLPSWPARRSRTSGSSSRTATGTRVIGLVAMGACPCLRSRWMGSGGPLTTRDARPGRTG